MISIIHPSARPEKAWETMKAWIDRARFKPWLHPVLCFDWGVDHGIRDPTRGQTSVAITWNTARRCSVDATNAGAAAAPFFTDWYVVISDDVLPDEGWDEDLRKVMNRFRFGQPAVIAVDTMDQEDPTHTLTVQILNRARYEQLGYIFHPDYTSMYADDEFTEHAKRDGVLVEALHIKMKHERFERDEVYERQQGDARFAWGKALLEHRRKHGFPRVTPGLASMRECVNLWNLGEGRVTGDVEKAISQLDAYENV